MNKQQLQELVDEQGMTMALLEADLLAAQTECRETKDYLRMKQDQVWALDKERGDLKQRVNELERNQATMWKSLKESLPHLVCEGEIIHISDLERCIREIEMDAVN